MSALPRLHTPDEIAKALGCSAWWVKEQARQRRIPFVMAGGAYRFTAEHLASIIKIFERLPEQSPSSAVGRRQVRAPGGSTAAVQLQARAPRRARKQPSDPGDTKAV